MGENQHDITEARGLRCGQCGGVFAIDAVAPVLSCKYCGAPVQVPSKLLAELMLYTSLARNLLRLTLDKHTRRATGILLPAIHFRLVRPIGAVLGSAMLLSACGAAGFAYLGWMAAAGAGQRYGTHVLVVGFTICAALVVALLVAFVFVRPNQLRIESVPTIALTCPNCGGRAGLPVGHLGVGCPHCRAHVVPTAAQLAKANASARAALLEARIRLQSTRLRRDLDLEELYGGHYRSTGIHRPILSELARRLGGQWAESGAVAVSWLGTHWADGYPFWRLGCANDYGLVAFHAAQRFPSLLDLMPPVQGDEAGQLQFRLLLAAWIPGISDDEVARQRWPAAVASRVADLQRLGAQVRAAPGGLVVEASEPLVQHVVATGAGPLVALADATARLATALEARPCAEIVADGAVAGDGALIMRGDSA